jgi:hypothetical protein
MFILKRKSYPKDFCVEVNLISSNDKVQIEQLKNTIEQEFSILMSEIYLYLDTFNADTKNYEVFEQMYTIEAVQKGFKDIENIISKFPHSNWFDISPNLHYDNNAMSFVIEEILSIETQPVLDQNEKNFDQIQINKIVNTLTHWLDYKDKDCYKEILEDFIVKSLNGDLKALENVIDRAKLVQRYVDSEENVGADL